jgi:hypothetical protein
LSNKNSEPYQNQVENQLIKSIQEQLTLEYPTNERRQKLIEKEVEQILRRKIAKTI